MSAKQLLPFLLIALLTACKKDENEFSEVPEIEFVSITPSVVDQFTDPVTITLRYKDGDGDLGENDADARNCFITDNRIGIEYEYRIRQLAPDGASIPIQGTLDVQLGGQGITDTAAATQSTSFTVVVRDRAGHQSNAVTTGSITIVR